MQVNLKTTLLGAGLLVVAGCAGNRVATDYNPRAGFSQYTTFAMASLPDSLSHQLIDDRIRAAVEGKLIDKGLRETNRAAADLYVGYGMLDRTRAEISTNRWGWGPAWGWRYYRWGLAWPAVTQHDISTYTDGTVVVSLVDAKTHREVWQGQDADVLSLPVGNPNIATKEIDKAVSRILAKYPPDKA